ncbi:hypothetical protein GTY75_20495 [Streptomyces sp. SID8381]|uniref:hypothetical protein n=1 Tax=unclassified Streptomyces TaxID=2593676 RepID=UPI0003A3469E|nr:MULTISPECIES: hypothetical protein [unclassified Streptomyces]MYX28981.1 hypothetical protein [Streptomyces sp. SID8381]
MSRARRAARRAAWTLAAACLMASAAGCAGQDDRTAGSEPDYVRSLISQTNGLYYHPFLREERGGPEAQSYALRALAETGAKPKVTVAARTAAALRSDALKSSALWGRYWLVPLRDAGAPGVLGRDDARAVEKLRSGKGWYEDPALDDGSDDGRLSATWAALEVEAATDSLDAVPAAGRAATVRWLGRLAHGDVPLEKAAVLARCLRLLGEPVPASLTAATAPDVSGFTERPEAERATLLEETYDYVLLQESAGRTPRVDRATWQQVLDHDVTALDHEQLYDLVHILRATGSPARSFSSVARRLEGDRLPDGTMRDPSSYLGTPDASLLVQRLRDLAGWPVRDERLLAAVEKQADAPDAPRDGATRLTVAALEHTAGGRDLTASQKALCQDPSTVPATVTSDNVRDWQRAVWDCADAGVPVPAPAVTRWDLDGLEGAQAAATLVVGLHQSGHEDRAPGWLTADRLEKWATEPGPRANVYDRALIVRAYLLLGGHPDESAVGRLAALVAAHRGCPGLPGLYRPDDEPGCDLKTTWAVWELDKALDGKLGALPSPGRSRD